MHRFNPEKELRKIQKGNKNKIIISVIAVLLIIAIGSSYALYQIRYNKQIIYTTVAPFNKKDIILSVKLDDQEKSTDKFPGKEEGYVYSHIECENNNIQNANWNEDTWKLNAEINGPDKCTVFFVKSPFHMKSCENKTMSECLLEEGQKFTNILAFDDPDQNGRYYGKDPANYIWFNCLKYDGLTNDNAETEEYKCEKWRIIGAFNNIDKVISVSETETTYNNQNLVKIIRADSVGNMVWNSANTNNWTNATLKSFLEEYYNGTPLNRAKGISGSTKEMIENIKWNLGGTSDYINSTASQFYEAERGNEVISGAPTTYDGYIGLMYPSDYGYATSGGGFANRSTCLAYKLNGWSESPYQTDCAGNDWLLDSISHQWTFTPFTGISTGVFNVINTGYVYTYYSSYGACVVRPSLYLKPTIQITSGQGTFEEPYIIK